MTSAAVAAPTPVAADVNVCIDMLTKNPERGTAARNFLAGVSVDPRFSLHTSEHILDGIYLKLEHFGVPEKIRNEVIVELEELLDEQGEILDPEVTLGHINPDREDSPVLALALDCAPADQDRILVTHDRQDLLPLSGTMGFPVITAARFNAMARQSLAQARRSEAGRELNQRLETLTNKVSGALPPDWRSQPGL